MSYMSDLDIQRQNVERMTGPLSMSEADLAALEERTQESVACAKYVRTHLTKCEHGDMRTLEAFDELLKVIGIHDRVVENPIT